MEESDCARKDQITLRGTVWTREKGMQTPKEGLLVENSIQVTYGITALERVNFVQQTWHVKGCQRGPAGAIGMTEMGECMWELDPTSR